MAWVLLNPVSWVLRPAMLPIVGGLGGLFYGSYDLTLLTIGTLTGVKPAHKCTFSHKASTFGGGLGVSGGALYVRWLFDPLRSSRKSKRRWPRAWRTHCNGL